MSTEPGATDIPAPPRRRAARSLPEDAPVETPVDEEDIWRLATALSGAASPDEVAVALAEEGAAAAGASFSNMAMLEAETNRASVVHGSVLNHRIASRWAEFHINDQTPLCEAMLSGRAVLLRSAEAVRERYPNLLAETLTASLSATASLPLQSPSGVCLGAIGFGWRRPQAFTPRQVRRLDLIAHMAAQALDRALLYERERGQASAWERAEAHLLQEAFLPRVLPQAGSLGLA
ncbi:MAG: hypothetical protein QOD01_310, partial [Actinomycetota bacterium]|nr:hypothetical protein [Actinomycetota bacterium]